MSTLTDIEARQTRDQTIRALLRWLMRDARDPTRIGRRVLILNYRLNGQPAGDRMLKLAKELGVSSARVSIAVADAEAEIFRIRNVISARIPPQGEETSLI
jgi:hypothetical protein